MFVAFKICNHFHSRAALKFKDGVNIKVTTVVKDCYPKYCSPYYTTLYSYTLFIGVLIINHIITLLHSHNLNLKSFWHVALAPSSDTYCSLNQRIKYAKWFFLCGTIFCLPRQLDTRDSMHINGFPSQTRDLQTAWPLITYVHTRKGGLSVHSSFLTAGRQPSDLTISGWNLYYIDGLGKKKSNIGPGSWAMVYQFSFVIINPVI